MNNTYVQLAEIILGSIASLGLLAGGVGYLVSQFRSGARGDKKDDLETQNELTQYLKNQVDGYKDIAEKQNKKIADLDKQLSTLAALLDEKDKTIAKYLEILQNRSPNLEKTLESIATSVVNINDFMKHIDTHLENSAKEMTITGTVTPSK